MGHQLCHKPVVHSFGGGDEQWFCSACTTKARSAKTRTRSSNASSAHTALTNGTGIEPRHSLGQKLRKYAGRGRPKKSVAATKRVARRASDRRRPIRGGT